MLISVYSNLQKFPHEINGEQVKMKIIKVCTKLYKSFKGTHTTGTTQHWYHFSKLLLGTDLKKGNEQQNTETYFHQNSRATLLLQVTS